MAARSIVWGKRMVLWLIWPSPEWGFCRQTARGRSLSVEGRRRKRRGWEPTVERLVRGIYTDWAEYQLHSPWFRCILRGISLETNEDWLQLHTPITFGQIWRRRKMNVDEHGKRNLDRKSDFPVADKAVVWPNPGLEEEIWVVNRFEGGGGGVWGGCIFPIAVGLWEEWLPDRCQYWLMLTRTDIM